MYRQLATVAAFSITSLLAYPNRVPAGNAGVPGENNCLSCHGGSLNPAGGKVELTTPDHASFTPGVKQRWTVKITDSDASRANGFQLTTRNAVSTATQAGDLAVVDASTATITSSGREYIYQTRSASTYLVEWTPPDAIDQITVYIAAAACRGRNDSHVYTTAITLNRAAAKPAISSGSGVVNGASYAPGFSPGAWISVFGANLASTTRLWSDSDFTNGNAPTQLDGVQVLINGKPGYVSYVSPGQVNVQAPDDATEGPVEVRVVNSLGSSDAAIATQQKLSPALFLFDATPRKYAAAVFPDGFYVAPAGFVSGVASRPAKPGDLISLYGTGFGATSPAILAGVLVAAPAPVAANVTATIGGLPADITYSGRTAIGLDQINLRVPDAADGDAVITVSADGIATQSGVYLRIQR